MTRRIAGIFAHPDDEVFCVGGTMATYVEAGAEALILSATRGEAGQIRDATAATRATLGAAREAELREACRCLGVQDVRFFDHLDGTLASLDRAAENLNALNFGSMLRFGHVLNRWVTRPMVPFPEELSGFEKAPWRPYLFQAREEMQALNLVDIQAMTMFEGWGAKMLFQRVIETTAPQVQSAANRIARIAPSSR